MFAKPFKIKSNNTLKNSEKKHLAQRVRDEFPAATEEKCKELVPVKSSTIYMKLSTHGGDSVGVYAVDGQPMLLEVHDRLVPTLCAMWKVPDLVPTLTVHSPVLPKLQGGAPLYLPGVVIPAQGVGFPLFARDTALALNTQDNAAACAVGFSTVGSADMLMKMSGVCFESVHVYGDLLCKESKFNKTERPALGPALPPDTRHSLGPSLTSINLSSLSEKEAWPSLGPARRVGPESDARTGPASRLGPESDARTRSPDPAPLDPDVVSLSLDEDGGGGGEEAVPDDMDALLRYCLLTFLKSEGRTVQLPLKTSSLYRNHLVRLCPAGRSLDVKKSSYKKMSKFLDAMQQEGLVEVREVERGVDAVTSLQPRHPAVTSHGGAPPPAPPAPADGARQDEYAPPQVREMYCVTAAVLDLLAPCKKGAALSAAEVRAAVTEHVRARGLRGAGGGVTLDHVLARICGKEVQSGARWEEVMSAVLARMTPCTEMRYSDGTCSLSKSKLEPIRMQTVTRSGNKKVTLVSNLEQFGFSLVELSRACQHGVAASCGVTRSPGAKHDQLMLQGDQTHFVARLLIEKYGLPKKYVEGADKALKRKNK